MNDARLDALLVAADPAAALDPVAVADDARARGDRTRILTAPRSGVRPRSRRALTITTAVAGLVALAALLVVLVTAVPGGEGPSTPAAAGLPLTPIDQRPPAPKETFRIVDRGVSHSLGWLWNAPGLGQLDGRPAVLIGAGPDCGCDALIAEAQDLWSGTAVGDLAVVGVAALPEELSWWRDRGTTFPIANGALPALAWTSYTPEPFAVTLVDRMGRVAAVVREPLAPGDLAAAVGVLLAEPRPPALPALTMIDGPVPPSVTPLGVFASPPVELPPTVENAFLGLGTYRESIRLAVRAGSDRSAWIARGRGDRLILASYDEDAKVVVLGSGTAREALGETHLVVRGQDLPSKPHYAVGVVPDGYTDARAAGVSAPVAGNAFILEDSRSIGRVTVTGPGLPPITM